MGTAIGIRHLRVFVAVAEQGNFTRAAEKLLLSQSALTVTVRQLEAQLGVVLFNRTTRQISLTVDGADFLPVAQQLVEDFDKAVDDVRLRAARRGGAVNIAVLPSIAIRLLPELMQRFRESHPDIKLTLRDDNGRGVHRQVLDKVSDFGISNAWKIYPELDYLPLTRDRFGLVCRHDDPLVAGEGAISWNALQESQVFIMAADTGVHTALQEAPAVRDIIGAPAGEVLVMITLFEMVRAGLGVTVLPELAGPGPAEPDLVFRRLVNPVVERKLMLIRRRNEPLSPGARRAWEMIRAQVPRKIEA